MDSSKIEYISSKDNRTVKRIMSLGKRKYRDIYGEYTVEGLRLVRDMADKGALSVLAIKESKAYFPDIQRCIEAVKSKDTLIYTVRDDIFDKLEMTVTGQGIIGIARKPINDIQNFIGENGLYVVLDGVQDPGNLGTVIRTAVAAGAKGIFLMKGTVDAYNAKCVRSTMSALHSIPIYEDVTVSQLQSVCNTHNLIPYITALTDATDYNECVYAQRTVLIFGNEGNGVSPAVSEFCKKRITIPIEGDIESLNVSVAAALCMYKVRERQMSNL